MVRLLLASWLGSAPERAELVLQWNAPAVCPGAAEIRARVSEQWGARDVVPVDAHATITEPTADDPHWRLVLQVRAGAGELGERVVEAKSCAALADAAVLVLAVAATTSERPTQITVPAPAAPPVDAPPPAAPTPARAASLPTAVASVTTPTADAAPTKRTRRVSAELAVAGGFDAAAMPGLGGTIIASAGVRSAWLGVHAFALHGVRRRVDRGDVGARHQLISGGVALCGLAPVHRFELGGCAKAELGALATRSDVDVGPGRSTQLWAAISLGAVARWWFARRWGLALAADAVSPLAGRSFTVGGVEVGRTGSVGARVVAGFVVRLPRRDFSARPGNRGRAR